MTITVLTPDHEVFRGPVSSVKVPGTQGAFTIKTNHAPLVSSLTNGRVELVTGTGEYKYYDEEKGQLQTASQAGRKLVFNIHDGFVEVLNNDISLLVQGVRNMR